MDLGSIDIQVFIMLVLVMISAFIALLMDYLKGYNDQLRERNIELAARQQERDLWLARLPATFFEPVVPAAPSDAAHQVESTSRAELPSSDPSEREQPRPRDANGELVDRRSRGRRLADIPINNWVSKAELEKLAERAARIRARHESQTTEAYMSEASADAVSESERPGVMETFLDSKPPAKLADSFVEGGALVPQPVDAVAEHFETPAVLEESPLSFPRETLHEAPPVLADAALVNEPSIWLTEVAPLEHAAETALSSSFSREWGPIDSEGSIAPDSAGTDFDPLGELEPNPGVWSKTEISVEPEDVTPSEAELQWETAPDVESTALSPIPVVGRGEAGTSEIVSLAGALVPASQEPVAGDAVELTATVPPVVESKPELDLDALFDRTFGKKSWPNVLPDGNPVETDGRWPTGLHNRDEFEDVVARGDRFTGIAVAMRINDYVDVKTKLATPEGAEALQALDGLVRSTLREGIDFAGRSAEDEFILFFPNETGADGQRRLFHLSERLWDFQLRSLGGVAVMLSWGGLEVHETQVGEAANAARERLEQARNRSSRPINTFRTARHAS
jgi:GGDEF domain-containing protein